MEGWRMIKLNGSRFTVAMPENLKEQPEVQAIAYAVGRQIEKLCAYADGARTYAAIQSMPERVLDLLAVELRTPAYDENYSIKVKRALIEGSLLFYTQMGTPAAVEKIIETIFGSGYISEWWEYNGSPYHFKAYTTNPAITSDDVEEFKRVLGSVKRLSAWLDEIILDLSTDAAEVYVAHWVHTGDFITLQRATL
ncbi:MAG: phage tail protein I [Bacillota bacterium]|nr:MAG: phage tail protein I [Bacillota bacterium]